MALLEVIYEDTSVDQRCYLFQPVPQGCLRPWSVLAKRREGGYRGKGNSRNMRARLICWAPGKELTGQGSTCPGQCLRRPWSVRVPGDPPGVCKKRPCLEFSLEQEGLKLRQLLDSLSLDSHVCCGLKKLKGSSSYGATQPNQTVS